MAREDLTLDDFNLNADGILMRIGLGCMLKRCRQNKFDIAVIIALSLKDDICPKLCVSSIRSPGGLI